MTFLCSYHQVIHEGYPILKTYECEQHGNETLAYCDDAATWLGIKR